MTIKLIKQVHSCYACVASSDVYLEKDVDLPFAPFFGLCNSVGMGFGGLTVNRTNKNELTERSKIMGYAKDVYYGPICPTCGNHQEAGDLSGTLNSLVGIERELALKLFNAGYHDGHHDTVEGQFCDDPSGNDCEYYHGERITEIIKDSNDNHEAEEPKEKR